MKIIAKDKIKDVLITRTAIKCLMSTELVEKIINFQGKDASEAVRVYSQVEFVGLGKFLISQAKVKRRIASYIKGIDIVEEKIQKTETLSKKNQLNIKLEGMKEKLEFYKTKLV